MFRLIRIALGLFLISLLSAGTVRAQGWGWEMWGGWAQTPEGALAQGMGHYYTGAGIFNEKTAIADSINLDTLMRWNDYLYQANLEAARRQVQRRRENSANNRAQNNAIIARIRDNPTARDIEMGDALNAAVDQLTDPRVSSSALRIASAPIEADVIRDIAFRNASEAVTIVLSQIKAVTKWPAALEGPQFADDKKVFEELVEKAIKEDDEGDISPATLKAGHDFINGLRAKLAAAPLEGTRARDEVSRFVKTFAGLVRLLERPDTTEAFNQLRMVKTTSLSNLIAFMEIYNLRFGAATTPRQRLIYRDLFAAIDSVRDQVVKGIRVETAEKPLPDPTAATDFFSKLFLDQASDRAKN
jgi:hypothetical protein